jgi:thiamine pyrophosphate-dependent acetolactate synthase large subunit-like protein
LWVESYEEFENVIRRSLNAEMPLVVDVPISPDEKVLPMIPPGGSYKEVIWYG